VCSVKTDFPTRSKGGKRKTELWEKEGELGVWDIHGRENRRDALLSPEKTAREFMNPEKRR